MLGECSLMAEELERQTLQSTLDAGVRDLMVDGDGASRPLAPPEREHEEFDRFLRA